MAKLDKPFKIMMDHHLQTNEGQWVYVHEDATLEDAQRHEEYENIIGKLPKDRYEATLIEKKTLEYTPSGEESSGAIYELHPKE